MTGICTVEGCGNKVQAKGLCTKHYKRQQRHGSPAVAYRPRYAGVACKVEGCNRQAYGHGLCRLHHSRQLRGVDIGPVDPLRGGTLAERAMRKVEVTGDHWMWTGQIRSGTPVLQLETTVLSARRIVYEDATGSELEANRYVRRACGERACVNPAHAVVVNKNPVTSR